MHVQSVTIRPNVDAQNIPLGVPEAVFYHKAPMPDTTSQLARSLPAPPAGNLTPRRSDLSAIRGARRSSQADWCIGANSLTRVPSPGALSTSARPPTRLSRWRML